MMIRSGARFRTMLSTAVVALVCASCGGGGSGGASEQDPVGGSENPPVAGSALAGRLWHNNYALDFRDGTQIASPSGAAPVQVTSNTSVTPWPDGSQYVNTEWNVYDEYSDLDVVDVESGEARYSLRASGYLRGARPSPVSKKIIKVTLGEDSVSPAEYLFVDLETTSVLRRMDATDAIDWLPDGRYIRITDQGEMWIGELMGAEQLAGQLALPAEHTIGAIWVNRQGTQIAIQLRHEVGSSEDSDLWLAEMDGTSLERLTKTTMTSYARWAPDGKHIAFDVDTGHFCNGVGCAGTCELWVAPASSREVTALESSGDAFRFKVKDRSGFESKLGCDLLAWTD